jgi:hypothetical protein
LIWLLFFLQLKHFVVDFLWQPEYEWRNKGTLFHPGGIFHSFKHAVVTLFILAILANPKTISVPSIFLLATLEFLLHYLIDYCKMNINRVTGWKADTDPEFWYLLGFDQLLHQLTYLGIAAIVF